MLNKVLLSFVFSSVVNLVFAQSSDSTTVVHEALIQPSDSTNNSAYLSGSALVTNNGINFVPTFSLNKPAAMFKFFAGRNRLSFDPEFNFSLEGKPWYFIFWLRYKLIQTDKFSMSTAGQLGLNFPEADILINGNAAKGIVTQRYLAADIAPTYHVTRNFTLGIYYLHSHGLDPGTTNSLDFVTLNALLSNIKIAWGILLKITPQVYYLHQDDRQGVYFSSEFVLEKKAFPLSLSSMISQPLQTDISGGQDFIWNVSLIYSFNMLHPKK
jgi:hypothetical protein